MLSDNADIRLLKINSNLDVFILWPTFCCHSSWLKNNNLTSMAFLPSAKPHGQHVVIHMRRRRRRRNVSTYPSINHLMTIFWVSRILVSEIWRFLPSAKPHGQHVVIHMRRRRVVSTYPSIKPSYDHIIASWILGFPVYEPRVF